MALPNELLDVLHSIHRHLPFRSEVDSNAMRDQINALNPPDIAPDKPADGDGHNDVIVDGDVVRDAPPALDK